MLPSYGQTVVELSVWVDGLFADFPKTKLQNHVPRRSSSTHFSSRTAEMGGVLGRPRRGLPDRPRYLPPGRYVRDIRDRDVVVLCSADAPLNLTVVPGGGDGRWGRDGDNDSTTGPSSSGPEYALVRGSTDVGGLVGSVVVDMRGGWATLRSPAAGDRYLLVDDVARAADFARVNATSGRHRGDVNLMGLRFRSRRRGWRGKPAAALWSVEHANDGDRGQIVVLRNRECPDVSLRPVGPHPRTKSAAALVLAAFLREELAAQMTTRASLLALERSIDIERDAAVEKLTSIRHTCAVKLRALVHRRRRAGMADAEQFLDGLTGVVDALRDQVKGASVEPAALTRALEHATTERRMKTRLGFSVDSSDTEGSDEVDTDPPPPSFHKTKAKVAAYGSDDDVHGDTTARYYSPDGRESPAGKVGDFRKSGNPARSEGWRVDADHLARVSTCWDLNVVDFRSRLTAHGIDDDVVASLQEAIRESAYEHFVVTGMRRYLLNQDGGEDEYGEAAYGSDGDDFDDASSMATGLDGSVVSSPGSRSVMSSMTPAKRAKAEERRERRAARRAALRARIRAGNAAVDFRKFKVGSLRDQLERSGVDAGPLAMLVHSLAHAMRQGRPKKRGGFLGRLARNILRGSDSDDPVDAEEEMAKKKKNRNEGTAAKKDDDDDDRFERGTGETFRAVLAQEKLSTTRGFVRAEDRKGSGEGKRTYEHEAPVGSKTINDPSRVRRDALRAAAAAAADAARDVRLNPTHDPETAAVVNFVGGLSLDDLRQELEGNSLLARGLDECVEALLETEWVGGVDGYVERQGERERALRHITVDAFRVRLERHGLEGSMLELNLLTNALAKTLIDDGAAREREKRRLSNASVLHNASPRQLKAPRPTRITIGS